MRHATPWVSRMPGWVMLGTAQPRKKRTHTQMSQMLHGAGIVTYIWVIFGVNDSVNIPATWTIWDIQSKSST